MTQCVIAQVPGRTGADFDTLIKEIAPEGLWKNVVAQIVGTSPDGLTIITLWDSDEGAQVVRDNVQPVLEKHGVKAKISILQVYQSYQRG